MSRKIVFRGVLVSSLLLFVIGFALTQPQITQAQSWTQIWGDEFNGAANTGVNTSNWMYDTGTCYPGCPAGNWGTGEVETMSSSTANVFQDGAGHLVIKAINSGGAWTGGRIETQRTDFQPPAGGMMAVEASIQQPNLSGAAAAGYWPAFWMLGAPFRGVYTNWPSIGEIDILEDVNGLSSVFGTLHCGVSPGGPCNETTGIGSGQHACSGCQTAFHTYRVEYDRSKSPEQMRWYLDGVNYFTVNANQVDATTWSNATNHGFFVIFDLAMGGGFPGAFGGGPTASTASGGTMMVDYVHVLTSGGSTSPTNTPTSSVPTATPVAGSGNVVYPLTGASTLSLTAGGGAGSDTMASAGGANHDGTPTNQLTYVVSGVNGTYNGGATAFNLYVDAGTNVGNGVQARISYDNNGDGVYDRVETYHYFATDPVVGWEQYNQTSAGGLASSSGTFANMTNGKIKLEVWNAIGNGTSMLRTSATSGNGSQSAITVPYSNMSTGGGGGATNTPTFVPATSTPQPTTSGTTTVFSTSLESGQTQPTWTNTVETANGGISNVGGICCGLTGPELGTRAERGHTGTSALMYSGLDNSATSSFAYMEVFSVNIPVTSTTNLSYWIFPQSTATSNLVSGSNSTCVAIDMVFTDGSNLRDSGVTDQKGNQLHPGHECGQSTMDAWNNVTANLSRLSGKTIARINVAYDQPANTGGYRGYVDDITITNGGSNATPVPTTAPTTAASFWGDTSTIPVAHNVMTFGFLNRTNGKYPDSQVYWSFNGVTHSIADTPYFDMPANSSGRMYFYLGSPTSQYQDFIEFTIAPAQFNGNTTLVDGFGLKLAIRLHTASGFDQAVGEDATTFAEDRSVTFQKFQNEVPTEFKNLAVEQAPFRIPAPAHPGDTYFVAGGQYGTYFNSYASSVGINANTQDIFGCSGAVLATDSPRCSALNRHVAQLAQSQWATPSLFYQAAPANYYAQFWHNHSLGGLAYGFPYDDYANQASYMAQPNPQWLLVAIGW